MASGQTKKKKPTKKKTINKGGRPSRYKAEYVEQAAKLCILGFTDIQLADFFGISEKTLYNWKDRHPKFLQALKENKTLKDAEVAETLLNKALGNIKVTEEKMNAMGDVMPCEKELPPCTTSIIFWLKNRQPELWRDKHEHDGETDSQPIGKVQIEVINANS